MLLLSLLLALPAQATCPLPNARIALHEFPPFYSQESDGTAHGSLVELISKTMDQLGCQWTTEFLPVPRLLAQISDGNADLAMIIHHPALQKRAYYGQVPVGKLVLKLFHQPNVPPIDHLSDIPLGTKVIVRRGYGYSGIIDQLLRPESGLQLVLADSHQESVALLQERKGAYLLNYEGPTSQILDQNGLYHISGEVIDSWPIYLVLSGRVHRGKEVIQQLDSVVKGLLASAQ